MKEYRVYKGGYMYTFKSFETLGTFTLLRPVFVVILIISLILFFLMIIPRFKNKIVNGFGVASLSTVSIIVSAQLIFYVGVIADEINLGGDAVSIYLFLAIAILSIVNPIIYFNKKTS